MAQPHRVFEKSRGSGHGQKGLSKRGGTEGTAAKVVENNGLVSAAAKAHPKKSLGSGHSRK